MLLVTLSTTYGLLEYAGFLSLTRYQVFFTEFCTVGGKSKPGSWVAQRFSTAFSPGRDPGDPGSSPMLGSLHGACFSLCLCLCLFVSHE